MIKPDRVQDRLCCKTVAYSS